MVLNNAYQRILPLAEQLEAMAIQSAAQTNALPLLSRVKAQEMPVFCRILTYGTLSDEEKTWLSAFIGQTATPSVSAPILSFPIGKETGELMDWTAWTPDLAPCVQVLMVLSDSVKMVKEAVESHIGLVAEGVPIVSFFYFNEQPSTGLIQQLSKEVAWVRQKVANTEGGQNVATDAQFLNADRRTRDDLTAFTAIIALKKTEEVITAKSLKAQEQLTALRLQRQQDLTATNKRGNISAVWSELKDQLSAQKTQFDRRIAQNNEQALQPNQGWLFQQLDQYIESLDYLEDKKQAKGKMYGIPQDFHKTLKEKTRQLLTQHAEQTLQDTRISVQYFDREMAAFLTQQNLIPLAVSTDLPDTQEVAKYVDRSIVGNDKPFEYLMPAKKITEYMMGARMYYMIAMMGMSMLGLSSAFSKARIYLLPVIIVVLGFGVYQMLTTKTKEDTEKMDKQLALAKEYLRNEIKRYLDNFNRLWQKLLDEKYAFITSEILRGGDRQVQNASRNNNDEERQRLQTTLNSLTQQERGFSEIQRNQSSFSSNLQRLKTEMTGSLRLYLQKWDAPMPPNPQNTEGGARPPLNTRALERP